MGDVAAKTGVSTSTASRALSGRGAVAEATRLRVAAAALELGYVPDANTSRLVTGRSQAVGLIVPNTGSWYFDEVLRGVQTTMLAGRIDVVLYWARPETEDRQLVFDYFVGRKRLDGIIAVGIEPSAHELADEVAAGAILACSRLGLRVPDDVSIVGVDDHPCAQLFNLTTVAQHPAHQGQQAAELLLRHLEEPGSPTTKVTDPIGLVIRASTGPASDQSG